MSNSNSSTGDSLLSRFVHYVHQIAFASFTLVGLFDVATLIVLPKGEEFLKQYWRLSAHSRPHVVLVKDTFGQVRPYFPFRLVSHDRGEQMIQYTDDQGLASFANLPNGKYSVLLIGPDGEGAPTFTIEEDQSQIIVLTVSLVVGKQPKLDKRNKNASPMSAKNIHSPRKKKVRT